MGNRSHQAQAQNAEVTLLRILGNTWKNLADMEMNMNLFPAMRIGLLAALAAFCACATLQGASENAISANTTGAIFNISNSDLVSGAGSDICSAKLLPGTFELDLTVVDEESTWEVDVQLGTSSLPQNLILMARIVKNGEPVNATLQGGGSWMQLSHAPQLLCTGQGSTSGIGLEFMIGNLSLVNCPPASTNYSQWLNFSLGAP